MAHKFSKPGGIAVGSPPKEFHVLRAKEGAVASDAAPYNVATYPKEGDDSVAVNVVGYDTIFVRAVFTGSGSVKVTPRVLDPEDDVWFRLADADGSVIETVDIDTADDRCYELRVAGRFAVFFQLTISGTVSDLTLYGIPGQPRIRT
jgi:hypothetical protein